MKKSLSDLVKKDDISTKAPKNFGAFKDIDKDSAKIDVDMLRKHNIFFATPCYGGMLTDQYFLSMFRTTQMLMKHGIQFRVTTLRNESLVTRARNILSAMFMESDCTHLFFIDSDIEFEPDSILRALAYDKDIVAGAYPKKALPVQYALNFKYINNQTGQVRIENGAVEVLDASTGFFCIKKKVFDKMRSHYPELHYKNDSNIDPKYNRYLSEDYTFCRRLQKMGGEIWVDLSTKLNHIGSYTFEGDVSKLISQKSPGSNANVDVT